MLDQSVQISSTGRSDYRRGKNYYNEVNPEVWRFETHSRPYPDSKGELIKGIGCPGEGMSLDEAWKIKHYLDATGRQFPDDYRPPGSAALQENVQLGRGG